MTARMGVISDTHGHVPFSLQAVRILETLDVDLLIHCGDIGSPELPHLFEAWPTHYVLGNVDRPSAELMGSIRDAGHTDHGPFGSLEVEGIRIAFLHGDDARRLKAEIHSGQWDLVCHGHTHRASLTRHASTWVLNPGAVFRARPRSLAVVDLPELTFKTIRLS